MKKGTGNKFFIDMQDPIPQSTPSLLPGDGIKTKKEEPELINDGQHRAGPET